eukprot:gene1560-biopygen12472
MLFMFRLSRGIPLLLPADTATDTAAQRLRSPKGEEGKAGCKARNGKWNPRKSAHPHYSPWYPYRADPLQSHHHDAKREYCHARRAAGAGDAAADAAAGAEGVAYAAVGEMVLCIKWWCRPSSHLLAAGHMARERDTERLVWTHTGRAADGQLLAVTGRIGLRRELTPSTRKAHTRNHDSDNNKVHGNADVNKNDDGAKQ